VKQKIQAVIFDMDGLMFDTEPAYFKVFSQMSVSRGKEHTTDFHRTLMGKRSSEVLTMLKESWNDMKSLEELAAEQDALLVQIYQQDVEKMKGLDTLLAFLNENGIRRCIGTSSRRFLVDVLLNKFKMSEEFKSIISGDMVSKGKPDPEIYLKCLSNLGLTGNSTLVLEDAVSGVRAAIAAGCSVCAIPSQYTIGEDFSLATLRADSLEDPFLSQYIVK
jgi:HAD superfamily hydrolase (TIGR01509 family)